MLKDSFDFKIVYFCKFVFKKLFSRVCCGWCRSKRKKLEIAAMGDDVNVDEELLNLYLTPTRVIPSLVTTFISSILV